MLGLQPSGFIRKKSRCIPFIKINHPIRVNGEAIGVSGASNCPFSHKARTPLFPTVHRQHVRFGEILFVVEKRR